MKKVNGHQIIQLFEQWAPKHLAMEGDPIGLHIGQLNRSVERVLVTLDVNEQVVDEAIERGVNLIIAHHPPLFRPLKKIETDTPQGRMIEKCIRHEIAVYAAHTNLDIAKGGVNDLMAQKLHLQGISILAETSSEALYKFVVFTPTTHSEIIREALASAGAGAIGDYEACSFTSIGEGRFTPMDGANPHIGSVHKAEVVEEEKIEVIVPERIKNRVLKALLNAHPYEEPAYDVCRLEQKGETFGLGRIGYLENELTLDEFATKVKDAFGVPALRFVGNRDQKVKKVAVLGGDGNKYIYAAKRSGADVLVTGDLYFHVAQDAESIGLSVVDPGHHVEQVMIEGVANYMTAQCEREQFDVEWIQSKVNTEPFQFK